MKGKKSTDLTLAAGHIDSENFYMNISTGSVDRYDGWSYQDGDGKWVNAVDRGEVIEVVKNSQGEWVEV